MTDFIFGLTTVLERLSSATVPTAAADLVARLQAVTVDDYRRTTRIGGQLLPAACVLHATHNPRFGTKPEKEAEYMATAPNASCHFLIGRDGRLYPIVPLDRVAWHAGVAVPPWVNDTSVGIEIHSSYDKATNTSEPLLPEQRRVLVDLLSALAWRNAWVGPAVVKRHGDVARPFKRKIDPHCLPAADLAVLLENDVWWYGAPPPLTTGGTAQ